MHRTSDINAHFVAKNYGAMKYIFATTHDSMTVLSTNSLPATVEVQPRNCDSGQHHQQTATVVSAINKQLKISIPPKFCYGGLTEVSGYKAQ